MRTPIALLLAAVSLLLGGCATRTESATTDRPKLIVFVAVDGLPQRQVVDYRDQFGPGGFRRFLDRGAWFANAHYAHAVTATAPGHAVMLTGAYPNRTGIIDNEWRDRKTGKITYNTGDTTATYIGHKTNELDGTSPRNLKVETVGDVLRGLDPRSKVIAISGKDRGAILPAGHKGTAYMYQAQTGQFASTTYYMKEHPQWVLDFHAKKPADGYFHREWRPLLDASAYARSVADEQKWFAAGGKLPKKVGDGQDAPGPRFYYDLLGSPYGDELTFAFARAAIAGEQLGGDEAPDILSISLSTHDYVNHAYGAESRMSHDHVLHLDRMLERFFRDLDSTVGKDNYVAVLTADHGFTPAPEYSVSQGRDAGRVSSSQLLAKVNAGLAPKFGDGQWALGMSAQAIVLNKPLMAERKVDAALLEGEVRKVLLAEKYIDAVYTRSELESGAAAGPYIEQVRRTWYPERSGDIALVLKPLWIYGSSSGSAATHGSAHPYDTQVPILIYGPKWVKPGRVDARVQVADIAPTLARMLRIAAPAQSEGRPLPLEVPGH